MFKFKHSFLIFIALILFSPTFCRSEIYTIHGTRHYRVFGIDFTLNNDKLEDDQAKIILRNVEEKYKSNELSWAMSEVWKELDDIYDGRFQGTIFLTILKTHLNTALESFLKPGPPKFTQKDFPEDLDSQLCAIKGFMYTDFECGLNTVDAFGDKRKDLRGYYVARLLGKCIPGFGNKDIWCMVGGGVYTYEDDVPLILLCRRGYYEAKSYARDENLVEKALEKASERSANNLHDLFHYVYKRVPENDPIFVDGTWDELLLKTISTILLIEKSYGKRVSMSFGQRIAVRLHSLISSEGGREQYLEKAKSLGINLHEIEHSRKKKLF